MEDTPPPSPSSDSVHSAGTFTCKIIENGDEPPRSNKKWTRARRCRLQIHTDHLHFDGRSIPASNVEKAVLRIYKSAFFFEYAVFSIQAAGKRYHFGLKYDDFWKGNLPFAVERVHEETPFILFRRSLIVLILVYIFWKVVQH